MTEATAHCPFCGSEAISLATIETWHKSVRGIDTFIQKKRENIYYGVCLACDARGPKSVTAEAALAFWNFPFEHERKPTCV